MVAQMAFKRTARGLGSSEVVYVDEEKGDSVCDCYRGNSYGYGSSNNGFTAVAGMRAVARARDPGETKKCSYGSCAVAAFFNLG